MFFRTLKFLIGIENTIFTIFYFILKYFKFNFEMLFVFHNSLIMSSLV